MKKIGKNWKNNVLILALLLAFSTLIGSVGNAYNTGNNLSESQALFQDVTGQMDFSQIMQKNFNSSVLSTSQTQVYERRTVIISLSGDSLIDAAAGSSVSDYATTLAGQAEAQRIYGEQDELLAKLDEAGIDYSLKYRYMAVDNAVAVELNTRYVSEIREMPGVSSVVIAGSYAYPQTVSDSDGGSAVTNVTKVYGTGVYDSSEAVADGLDGSGTVVAIIDTGLDYTHDAFSLMPDGTNPVRFTEEDILNILEENELRAEERQALSGSLLSVSDVYLNAKVPFAYDYADNDTDVYPSYSNHGTHVAGIVAGHDVNGYTDKDGNHVDEEFIGVAPEAQLVICKVFTDDLEDPDLGGAVAEDILAALEDCVLLGVDVINMSLGTSCGFTTTNDGDDEGEYLNRVYTSIGEQGINLVCAASNDYSSGYGGVFGTNLASNPDSGTVGSPATFAAALSVASISGKQSSYMLGNGTTAVFFEESNDEDGNPFDFIASMLAPGETTAEFEYVVVPGVGRASDYTSAIKQLFAENPNRIALVKRGDTTFKEKVEVAKSMGAKAIIVYNNVSGTIRMQLGEVVDPIPAVSIDMNAGNALVEAALNHTAEELAAGAVNRVGTIVINTSYLAGPFMSEFSSWGCTPDLKLKPEITAHGGEITSSVPGGYDEQSGTSMASPNMAGVVALIRSYVKTSNPDMTPQEITRRVNQLLMSTATTVYDEDGLPYSPRKQGAGLGSLDNSRTTGAFLWTDNAEIDYRPKVELGDDKEKVGVYTITFKITNFGTRSLSFKPQSIFMTETLAIDGLSVAEQAYLLDDVAAVWKINGNEIVEGYSFTVPAGVTTDVELTLTLSDDEKKYIDESFENGMFVEGFAKLISGSDGQCDLVLPFMGFYGDWSQAPMLDYDAYELAEYQQDSSILEDEKPQASVWATQPYTVYYNEDYVLPMGGYVYLLPDDADPVYTSEDHNALSCFNQFFGEDNAENYMTSYKLKGLYAGLLRNARSVDYQLINADTGEVLESETVYRVSKAYSGGGSGRPALVDLDLDPLAYDLVSNGHYTMTFEFFLDYEDGSCTKNTYSFDFTIDYEAPLLQDIRVRYYDYKDGNKTKQRIYLDLDIYDNHYTQSVMLCYLEDEELVLATDYVTPVYNSTKNGTTTVSIEITDLYEKYKDSLYVEIDDYALNHSVYWLNLSAANQASSADDFELAPGEDALTLGVYNTHTVALAGIGDANLSNFKWSSDNRSVADVKNGEIVGLSEGTAVITVSNGKGVSRSLTVTVTGGSTTLPTPSISFGVIKDGDGTLVKASGAVTVYPGMDFRLDIVADPWYYPTDSLTLVWESTNPDVVTVDQSGNVTTVAEGTAVVKASIAVDGKVTAYTANVTMVVEDPFVVSNYSLTEYKGPGGVVVIPTDKNIMMIGEDAFKDNDTITEVVIPKSVTSIGTGAFENCTALKSIYFVDTEEQPIADADIGVIYGRAFAGCTSLELLDLSNVKVVTLGRECFYGCENLREIRKMTKIGTVGDYAFAGCTSLTSLDLSELHVAGTGAFAGCTALTEIKTGWFTSIGTAMFNGCTGLRSVTLSAESIGNQAFSGCTGLRSVTIALPEGETSFTFYIGDRAFEGCTALQTFTVNNGCKIASIGNYAFASTALTSFTVPEGLISLGENILSGSKVTGITISDSFDFENLKLLGSPFYHINISLASGTTKYVIENGVLYNQSKTTLLMVLPGTTRVTIPDSVTAIADYAFAGSSVTTLTVPASVRTIGTGAFMDSKLASITFAGSGISEIAEKTFANSKLIRITIPAGVTAIGDSAFEGTALTSVNFAGTAIRTLGNRVFADCTDLESIVLPDGITTMGSATFSGCESLRSATLPSVKSLGSQTFRFCYALTTVTFGENATTVGDYTFYENTSLKSVSLSDSITEIGAYAFVGCTSLKEIDLNKVTTLNSYAFAECTNLKTVTGLDRIVTIGDMAFYDCNGLTELNLASAEFIGDGAFAIENGKSAYTVLSIPAVKQIGIMAFIGGGESTVTLPASLTSIGYGAFAESGNLTAFTVDSDNVDFFAVDGVLYRRLPTGMYELTAYPGGRMAEQGSYTVIDGTSVIAGYAVNGLKSGAMSEVVLPYSLKFIGLSAFADSGVTKYIFNCIQAPSLATVYREDVEALLEENATGFQIVVNGLYYANFDTLLAYYTDIVGETSSLVICYPENGVGYDNYVYTTYFGKSESLGVLMDDITRSAIEAIGGLESVETVTGWSSLEVNDTNRDMILAFAEKVKEARRLYNNILTDEQRAFVSDEELAKLTEIEGLMRSLKEKFNIALVISSLTYNQDYIKDYNEGDSFSMEGLTLTVVYDDGSTEPADLDKLVLKSPADGILTQYDLFVVFDYVSGDGMTKEVQIPVNVKATGTSAPTEPNDTDLPNDTTGDDKSPVLLIVLLAGGGVLVCAAVVLVIVLIVKKKGSGKGKGPDHNGNGTAAGTQDPAEPSVAAPVVETAIPENGGNEGTVPENTETNPPSEEQSSEAVEQNTEIQDENPEIESENPVIESENPETPEIEGDNPGKKRHNAGTIVKWTVIGVAMVAVIGAIVYSAVWGDDKDDSKLAEVQAQIVYKANGGLFENNMDEKTIGYSEGAYPLDIGNVTVTNGSVDIKRQNYVFGGWYYPVLDESGNIVYEDAEKGIVKLGEAFDFTKKITAGQEITLYAAWIKDKTLPVILADGTLVDKNGVQYHAGDVIRELTANPQGQFVKFTGSNLLSLPDKQYTFVQYYADAACTIPVSWPITTEEGVDADPIYAKFIEGDWKIVSDADSAKKMLEALISGNYYLICDVDLSGAAVTISNNATFGANVEGNGFTLSNFTVTKRAVESQGTSLFGTLKETASLHNLNLTDFTFEVMLKGDANRVYFLFGDMPENPDVSGFSVNGRMTVSCPEGSLIGNLQEGEHFHWILSAGESDDAALADGKITVEVVCTVGNATYTYPDSSESAS
ncbi:MAG: leucine-rich repeat protein [Eubacteriales bacterium]